MVRAGGPDDEEEGFSSREEINWHEVFKMEARKIERSAEALRVYQHPTPFPQEKIQRQNKFEKLEQTGWTGSLCLSN